MSTVPSETLHPVDFSAQSPFSIAPSNRRIDPTRRRHLDGLKGDGTPDDNNRVEIGPTHIAYAEWDALGLKLPQLPTMRAYRLNRLVEQLRARDYAGILLFDPLNIRYASDSSNMQLWTTHNPVRACFVGADGYMVLWDFHGCEHLSAHLSLINERRPATSFFYFESGERTQEHADRFAAEIDALLRERAGGNRRLAVDRIEPVGFEALQRRGLAVKMGQPLTELARAIKGEDDILAMRCAIAACEAAVTEMRDAVRPGLSESEAWAVLHAGNIKRGGEWIETRILSSGPRTNPWYQECGPRIMQAGELLAFDTDMVGCYGMISDISRTWLIGEGKPNAEQITAYQLAYEHIMTNRELLKPGMRFSEITAQSHRLPEAYRPQRYGVIMHGAGLCDEYPSIRYPEDQAASGYDGVLEAGMVLCVEAYVGKVGGKEGVKLENQVLVTESGYEDLTRLPFEPSLLVSSTG